MTTSNNEKKIKPLSIRLSERDYEYIKTIMESINSDSPSGAIKYAIKVAASNLPVSQLPIDTGKQEDPNIEIINGQEFVNPHPTTEEDRYNTLSIEEQTRRDEIRAKAKANMEGVEMVMTSRGLMTSHAAKLLNLTFTEALSGLNGQPTDEQKVKDEKRSIYRRNHPEVSEEHLDYLMTLETDVDGNLIYE